MAETATVRVRGVDDGASDTLERIARSAERMGETVERAAEDAHRGTALLGGGLARATLAMGGISLAAGLVGGAFARLRESAEQYFQSTEAGRAVWSGVQEDIRSLRGGLFELVIGTDDAGEAAARLASAVEIGRDIIAGLGVLLRGPIALAMDILAAGAREVVEAIDWLSNGAITAARELRELQRATEALARASEEGDDRIRSFIDSMLGDTEQGAIATTTRQIDQVSDHIGRLAEEALVAGSAIELSGQQVSDWGAQVREAVSSGDLDRPLQALDEWTTTTGDVMRRSVETGLTVRDVIEGVTTDAGSLIEALGDGYATIDELTGRVHGSIEDASDASVRSSREAIAQLTGYADALRQLKQISGEASTALVGMSIAEIGGRDPVEANTLASSISGISDAMERARMQVAGLAEDLSETLDAAMRRSAALAQSTSRIVGTGFGSLAQGVGDGLANVAIGAQSFADAMGSAIGTALDAAASAAIAEGLMISLNPLMGGPVVGGPLIGAGVAGKLLAAVLGGRDHGGDRGGGAQAAGLGPRGDSGPVTTNNLSIINNFGGGRNRYDESAAQAAAVNQARRLGMLPGGGS